MNINEDTWFFLKSIYSNDEIKAGRADFSTIAYRNKAREITNNSFKLELKILNLYRDLSENEKCDLIKYFMCDILKDTDSFLTLNARTLFDGFELKIQKMIRNYIFPFENESTSIILSSIIVNLETIMNNSVFFYVDVFSIFSIVRLFLHYKYLFLELENKNPSKTIRKKAYKTITSLKNAIILKDKYTKKLSHKEMLYAELLGKFYTGPQDLNLFSISFSSKTQSLKKVLKLIPDRIITHEEILDHNRINFKRNSKKNILLITLLKSLFPERKYYCSLDEYPSEYNMEFMKYVDSTVKQMFF